MKVIMETNETTRNQRLIGYPNPNRPQSWFYFFEDYPTIVVSREGDTRRGVITELLQLIETHEESQKAFNEYPKEDVEQWYQEWREDIVEHFATKLFDLIAHADQKNRERINQAFPEFVRVFNENRK